jgi:glycosyltransferase domain-containing protein
MKQDDFITIIIPTYNRPGYLKRILGYYSDCRIAHRIIIADGSSDEIKKANKETASSFPALKVLHLHGYSPGTSPLVRIFDALKHADTKYSVLCADDDFITPNGIDRSVNFLEANPDFALAYGRYIAFHLEDNRKGESKFCWQTAYSSVSIVSPDPVERLTRYLSEYVIQTFYAVHRTDLLQMIWKETACFAKDANFSELLFAMLDIIYGKMKCLDVLYCARDMSSIRVEHVPTMKENMDKGIYDEHYAAFRECLSTHLSKQSHSSLEEAEKVVDKAMSSYLKKYSTDAVTFSTRMGYFLDYLKLPKSVDSRIRWLYRRLTKLMSTKKHSTETLISSTYGDDLNRIRSHVLSHSR